MTQFKETLMMSRRFFSTLLLIIAASLSRLLMAADDPAEVAAPSIRVLILTGRNNHRWQETTPALRKLLEDSGKFSVDTTIPPRGLTPDNLQNYDVILSDWNSWGGGSKQAEAEWTDAVREAYLDFVRQGGGHVTIHAGGSSFYEGWPAYRQVSLVFWNLGATGHGRRHEFKIRIDQPDHPIMSGLDDFATEDELWNRPGVVAGATVLASAYSDQQNEPSGTGRWEPSVVTASYGRGRCFAMLLGHDAKTMENQGFQKLLIRGVEWAAGAENAPPPP